MSIILSFKHYFHVIIPKFNCDNYINVENVEFTAYIKYVFENVMF